MKNNSTIEKKEQRVARPLKVLVPLIKKDLADGKEAARQAGMEYYIAAGEKLIEAKEQVGHFKWGNWLQHNFHLSLNTAQVYMRAARKNNGGVVFETMQEVRGDTRKFGHAPSWTEPVRDVLQQVRTEALNWKKHEISLEKERSLERRLALQLIDIGFKVLSVKLHPDKGGSHEAMQRLNRVRARLKQAA